MIRLLVVLALLCPLNIHIGYVTWNEEHVRVAHFEDGTELYSAVILEIKND